MGVAAAVVWRLTVHPGRAAEPRIPGDRIPYAVQVLNASGVDGLARAVTHRLREAGIDVVSYGTADSAGADSTKIVVRGTDAKAGDVVRDALGVGQVVADPDPHLLLDVSVILGRDLAPVDRNP